jgi:hypothetical protein
MSPSPSSWVYTWLQFDHLIQTLGICASICGVLCTTYALVEFFRVGHRATELQRLILNAHIWGQFAILFVQVMFLIINALVYSMPDIPVAMYLDSDAGPWVVGVILFRKLTRLLMIVVLAVASVHRVWSFHRIAAHLDHPENRVFYHRRSDDPPTHSS